MSCHCLTLLSVWVPLILLPLAWRASSTTTAPVGGAARLGTITPRFSVCSLQYECGSWAGRSLPSLSLVIYWFISLKVPPWL